MTAAVAAVAILVLGHRFRFRALRPVAARRPRSGGPAGAGAAAALAQYRRLVSRRNVVGPSAVAEWCAGLARAARAGDTLRFALEHQLPADGALRVATDPLRLSLHRGRTVADAADLAADLAASGERGLHHLALLLDVVATCDRVGGSAAAPLERAAAALRLRAADDQERAAQSAQARFSAHAMTVVPLAVLGLFAATDGDVRAAVGTPAGAGCVVAGVLLNGAGWAWMRRIIRGVGH